MKSNGDDSTVYTIAKRWIHWNDVLIQRIQDSEYIYKYQAVLEVLQALRKYTTFYRIFLDFARRNEIYDKNSYILRLRSDRVKKKYLFVLS